MCQAATGKEVRIDIEPASGFLRGPPAQPPSQNDAGEMLVPRLGKKGGCRVEGAGVEPSPSLRSRGAGVSKYHAGSLQAQTVHCPPAFHAAR